MNHPQHTASYRSWWNLSAYLRKDSLRFKFSAICAIALLSGFAALAQEKGVDTQTIVAIVAPLVLVQLTLMAFALRDLMRPERKVRGASKLVWGIVIVLGELLGPLLYFLFGRQEQEA